MIKKLSILTVAIIIAISVNAQAWQQVGTSISVSNASNEKLPQLFADGNGDMYMAYINDGNGVAVTKLNDAGDEWEQVGSSQYISSDLYVTNLIITGSTDELFVSYTTETGAKVFKFEGTSWTQVGDTFIEVTNGSLEITFDGQTLAVLYNDQGAGDLRVEKWNSNNSTWEQYLTVIENGIFMNTRYFYKDSDYYYVIYGKDNNIIVKSDETGAWTTNATYAGYENFKFQNRTNRPNIAILNSSNIEIYEADDDVWEQIGNTFDMGGQSDYIFGINQSGGSDRIIIYRIGNYLYAKNNTNPDNDWETLGASPFITEYSLPADVKYSNSAIPYFVYFNLSDNPNYLIEVMKYDISTEIDELSKNNILTYPNPTNGIINFEFADNKIHQITISEITGKTIIEKVNIQQNEMIDLSNFESGIYIIKIQTDKEIFTTKIVKE